MGTYKFHGSWWTNDKSRGRGYFRCYGFTCWFDPGDTLSFSAILTGNWACRRSEYLDIEESFSGGGTYH
ncbi:hypothetical protein [Streptomyces sp. NPDC055692]|uniref:hypothetical protein n=1 Tax=Streptomyces sp. NPDC055692 TaxID=3155683 RepID=UPI0034227661